MRSRDEESVLTPMARAIAQLGDRAFLDVLLRCLAWSAICFIALHVLAVWLVQHVLQWHGPMGWAGDLLATVGATLLTLWLFLPLAAAISTFYLSRIAAAVERRYYPFLPPAQGASIAAQAWDGAVLCARILSFSVVSFALVLILPGAGIVLAWAIAAYALGRGLFVAVSMRRMPRSAADALYRRFRWQVLAQGGLMAAAACLPVVNLLIPLLGTAAMVHVLDDALSQAGGFTCS
jgi:CysZ protein